VNKTMTRLSWWCRSHFRRSGTTASITTSSIAKASQVPQLRMAATASSQPPGCDSVIATIGRVSAAAISIGVLRASATRVLRASIPGP
jgi:hypothetical protein